MNRVGAAERVRGPEPWRVCVRDSAGRTWGAGMVLGDAAVLTCAHVVSAALGGVAHPDPPDGEVVVHFVGLSGAPSAPARVLADGWRPLHPDGRGDVALLRLRGPSPDVPGAPLRRLAAVRDRLVHTYGFPHPHEHGVWVNDAVLAGPAGPSGEWVQLNSPVPGERVRRGFSGAGVIDKATGSVIGMVVTEYTDAAAGLAYMIPVGTIAEHLPAVGRWIADEPVAEAAFGVIVVVIGDRRAAVESQFPLAAERERLLSPGGGDGGLLVTVDAAGKSSDEVSSGIAERAAAAAVPTRPLGSPAGAITVAVAGVDESPQPEAVLTDVVRPWFEQGATVLVQFSAPDAPGAALARRWQREGNGHALRRLAALVARLSDEEDRTHARARRVAALVTPVPAVPAPSADLVLRLRALTSADEGIEPDRVRRGILLVERRIAAARTELSRVRAELDALAARHEELRGRLRAYSAMAAGHGFMEDDALDAHHRPARTALEARPCLLTAAEPLVERYVRAVRARMAGRQP